METDPAERQAPSARRIVVEVHSHQFYARYEGVPLLWCQAVAHYEGETTPVGSGLYAQTRGHNLQVPAVVLQTDTGPRLVLLQQQYHHSTIKELP